MLFPEPAMVLYNMSKGYIHSIESFGAADGPGVRFVIFLQGCNFRCRYCHNPDTWSKDGGTETDADTLLKQALRYRNYWKNGGGITVSGGEPLLQMEFLTEFFRKAKAEGIHTTLDTAGGPFTQEEPFFSQFQALMLVTDLVLLDIKEMDATRHKHLTGQENGSVLDLARYLDEIQKPVWIRHVLVPGHTDFSEDLDALGAFLSTLSNVERIDVLPYHTLGTFKWENLGIPYSLKGIRPPTEAQLMDAKQRLGLQ